MTANSLYSNFVDAADDNGNIKNDRDNLDYIKTLAGGIIRYDLINELSAGAVYPIIGGTAFSHKFNFMNPVDSDAAFRLSYFGGLNHSSDGILSNGTTGYMNTFINPLLNLEPLSTNVSTYIKSSPANARSTIMLGANDNGGSKFFYLKNSSAAVNSTKIYLSTNSGTTQGVNMVSPPLNALLGYFAGNLKSNVASLWNGSKKLSTTNAPLSSNTQPNLPIYVFAQNQLGVGAVSFDTKLINYLSIGAGLTETKAIQLSNLVYYMQGIKNRQ